MRIDELLSISGCEHSEGIKFVSEKRVFFLAVLLCN